MYEAGKKWNEVKEANPEKLESPMRVILMQKLVLTVLERFNKVMGSEEKMEQAKALGWLTEDGKQLAAMRWHPEQRKHVPCPELKALDPDQVKQWLKDMAVLCANPRAVNRFHKLRLAHPQLCGTQDQGGQPDVDLPQRDVPLLGVGHERRPPEACTDATGATSTAGGTGSASEERWAQGQRQRQGQAGRGHRETQILRAILVNKANHCYTNALIKCLALLAVHDGEGGTGLLPVQLDSLLRSFTSAARPTVVWDSMFWRALLARWNNPHSQHDIAELLQHLGTCCPQMVETLGFRWEARSQETGVEAVVDAGCSVPLYVSPSSEVQWGRAGTTVQRLIEDWHEQADIHAAQTAPRALVIQAGRFSLDQHGNPVRKWRYDLVPDREIRVPRFTSDGGVDRVTMRLSSFVVHKAILHIDEQLWMADDNNSARRCETAECSEIGMDTYLLFYVAA
eukprot:s529_g15.t1